MYFFIYKALFLHKFQKKFVKNSPYETEAGNGSREVCRSLYNKLARKWVKYYTIEVHS